MRYSERVSQPSDTFRIGCPICTSRSGWGLLCAGKCQLFFRYLPALESGRYIPILPWHYGRGTAGQRAWSAYA